MPATFEEITSLADDVRGRHGDMAINLACLVQVSRTLFRNWGSARGANLEPLLDLQVQTIREYAKNRGVECQEVCSALEALERAGATAGYLATIPE